MSLFHESDLGRTRLLAASALEGEERARAERHLATCEDCRMEFEGISRLLGVLGEDPVREARLPIWVGALQARVAGRLEEGQRTESVWRPALAAVATLLLIVVSLPHLPPPEPPAAVTSAGETAQDEGISRLERTLAREETARYLSAAQEVLVTVSNPSRCPLKKGHVDVGEESERSRTLLRRRTLLAGSESVPTAQPVLNDVEKVLREVAALDPCASKVNLEEIDREVRERRLLLRIDLMTQELAG